MLIFLAGLLSKPAFAKTILVLGSGGVVGTGLVHELRKRSHSVIEIRNRLHIDLRVNNSLGHLYNEDIDFCFFLACEVGGSKYITSTLNDKAIWDYNMDIYDNVFHFLRMKKTPFIFSSSQLAVSMSTYRKAKLRGEKLMETIPYGKSVRFWNVYGPEKIGSKSHIISDWIHQCLRHGYLESRTSGDEKRQFVHSSEMAVSLSDIMDSFEKVPKVLDVTSGVWLTMRNIANIITAVSGKPCQHRFTKSNSSNMMGLEPSNPWIVKADIWSGIRSMVHHYERTLHRESCSLGNPYVSVILATSNDSKNDIRRSTFNFLQTFLKSAQDAHLSYELIVVQYNPKINTSYPASNFFLEDPTSDQDLPFSQLFPWTHVSSTACL